MITLLAMILASPGEPITVPPHKLQHCYSNVADFTPRTIKLIGIKENRYIFKIKTESGWFGNLENNKQSIDTLYPEEVDCETK